MSKGGEKPVLHKTALTHAGQRASHNALYNPTYTGNTKAGLNSMHQTALNNIVGSATDGNPNVGAALDLNQRTTQGEFLGPNPHLSAALAPIREEFMRTVSPSIDAGAAGAGRLGSGAHAVQRDTAEQQLSDTMGRVAFQNYAQERGLQQQAAAQAPALSQARYADAQHLLQAGNLVQGAQQNTIDDQVRQFYERKDAPLELLRIGAGINGPTATSNPTAGALGGAVAGAGAGSSFGPYGAAAGAVIGGVGGYYGSK